MLVDTLLLKSKNKLKKYGNQNPLLDSRILLAKVLNKENDKYFLSNSVVSESEKKEFFQMIDMRSKGMPVSRIISKRSFWNNEFYINDYTLDPRPDSEILVSTSINYFANRKLNSLDLLDLGSGSGCLILSVLKEFPNSWGVATDISIKALEVAKFNASELQLDNRIHFINTYWTNSIIGKFDLIMSNPPYIQTNKISELQSEVKDYDPFISLNGGIDGLDCYRVLGRKLFNLLKPDGIILLEIGFKQEKSVTNIMHDYGYNNIFREKDLSGIVRCLGFKKK